MGLLIRYEPPTWKLIAGVRLLGPLVAALHEHVEACRVCAFDDGRYHVSRCGTGRLRVNAYIDALVWVRRAVFRPGPDDIPSGYVRVGENSFMGPITSFSIPLSAAAVDAIASTRHVNGVNPRSKT